MDRSLGECGCNVLNYKYALIFYFLGERVLFVEIASFK